jgi:hypothetical protein
MVKNAGGPGSDPGAVVVLGTGGPYDWSSKQEMQASIKEVPTLIVFFLRGVPWIRSR